MELTGERTVPGVPSENYWFQRHVAAYRFAATIVRGDVIDAGCGEGYGTALLARRGLRVTGVELDGPTVEHARRRYGPRFVRGDLTALPFRRGSTDGIAALQVLEHLGEPERFLDECARVLRPLGTLVLSTPNRLTFPAGLNPFHPHEYDAAELEELLRRRFRDVLLLGVGHGRWLRRVDRRLGESVQHRLVRTPYTELPGLLRAALRAVRPNAFEITPDAAGSLDLLAVCRSIAA